MKSELTLARSEGLLPKAGAVKGGNGLVRKSELGLFTVIHLSCYTDGFEILQTGADCHQGRKGKFSHTQTGHPNQSSTPNVQVLFPLCIIAFKWDLPNLCVLLGRELKGFQWGDEGGEFYFHQP